MDDKACTTCCAAPQLAGILQGLYDAVDAATMRQYGQAVSGQGLPFQKLAEMVRTLSSSLVVVGQSVGCGRVVGRSVGRRRRPALSSPDRHPFQTWQVITRIPKSDDWTMLAPDDSFAGRPVSQTIAIFRGIFATLGYRCTVYAMND